MKTKTRPVVIETIYRKDNSVRAYLVCYVDREKRQHHLAAQFDASVKTLAEVEAWITKQQYLELVEETE